MTPSLPCSPRNARRARDSWRRLVRPVFMAVGLMGLTAAPAWAQNPVFLQGPNFGARSIGFVEIPLAASGGASPGTYTWQVTGGALPPGLTLRTDPESWPSWFPSNTSAAILGVATVPSSTPYSFTLRVTSGGTFSEQNATLAISPLVITEPWTLPRAYVGRSFSYQLTSQNGAGAVTWSTPHAALLASHGLTLNPQGIISGTPTTSGFPIVTLNATDGVSVGRSLNIEIHDIEITSPLSCQTLCRACRSNYVLTASGGTGPYVWSFGSTSLPTGLVLESELGPHLRYIDSRPGSLALHHHRDRCQRPVVEQTCRHQHDSRAAGRSAAESRTTAAGTTARSAGPVSAVSRSSAAEPRP